MENTSHYSMMAGATQACVLVKSQEAPLNNGNHEEVSFKTTCILPNNF